MRRGSLVFWAVAEENLDKKNDDFNFKWQILTQVWRLRKKLMAPNYTIHGGYRLLPRKLVPGMTP